MAYYNENKDKRRQNQKTHKKLQDNSVSAQKT